MGLRGAVAPLTFPWFPPPVQNGKSLTKTQQDLKMLCPARAVGHVHIGGCNSAWGTLLAVGCLSFPTAEMGITGARTKGSETESWKWHTRAQSVATQTWKAPQMGFLRLVPVPVTSDSEVSLQRVRHHDSLEAECGQAQEHVKNLNSSYEVKKYRQATNRFQFLRNPHQFKRL